MEENLFKLLELVGPLNSRFKPRAKELIQVHGGDIHAARNSIFREIFTSRLVATTGSLFKNELSSGSSSTLVKTKRISALFSPVCRQKQETACFSGPDREKNTSSGHKDLLVSISEDLLKRIIQFVDFTDMLNIAEVSHYCNRVANGHVKWFTLCRDYHVFPLNYTFTEKVDYRTLFRKYFDFMSGFYCPDQSCRQTKIMGSIVPIVYGFPSKELVRGMFEDKVLVLGDDHIIEGRAVWICKICKKDWTTWPYGYMGEDAISFISQ
mmetsp:Transcript_11357/g.13755  ORF Transcript_11357/g.13755 Transcript_11357/m.13755 type:complete len:266 (-) Transcript_11357:2146-2943(-)